MATTARKCPHWFAVYHVAGGLRPHVIDDHLKRRRRHGRAAGGDQRAGGDLFIPAPGRPAQLRAGLQTVASLPERRKQRRVAAALCAKACRRSSQVRPACFGTDPQGEVTRLPSLMEPQRLLAQHLH